jgi:hypothetical protein
MGEGRSTLSRPILQCEDYTIIDSEVETDCLFATFIQAIYLLQGEDPTNLPKLASDLREWRGACAHSRGWIQEETILEELTGMARRYKIAQRYIALRIRAQREITLKQATRDLWTTDTIETILTHILLRRGNRDMLQPSEKPVEREKKNIPEILFLFYLLEEASFSTVGRELSYN